MPSISAPNGCTFDLLWETEHFAAFRATTQSPKYREVAALRDFEYMLGLGFELCAIGRGDTVIFRKVNKQVK